MPRATRYELRWTFRVPLDFAFRWCTDYTTEDGKLAGDGHERRVLHRSARKVVYEDLYDYPYGWFWSRYEVLLRPPDRWTARAEGNYRKWRLVYTLRRRGPQATELRFQGRREPVGLERKNPSQRAMAAELNELWGNYRRAMEADYRRERGRGRPRRRGGRTTG